MENDILFLTLDEVLIIHKNLIDEFGGSHGLRDVTLLESALYRPQAMFGGEDLYPTIFNKAASFMHSLLLNHPFVDGNKRTGVAAALTFLYANGIKIIASREQLIDLAIQIESKEKNIKEITLWLEEHVK